MTTTQLVMYAGASGDFNRIHYDLPFAQEAGLGGVIAHGMLTMGFSAQLLSGLGGPRGFVRNIEAKFVSSVRPGDVVKLAGTVADVQERDGVTDVSVRLTGKVDDREVITGTGVVSIPI